MDNQASEAKLKTIETQGQQEDSDKLGRRTIQILAFLGGIAGILIATMQILARIVDFSSTQIGASWGEIGLAGSAAFLLLGLAGIAGAFLATKNRNIAGWLLLCSGLLGFPAGYIAWTTQGSFLGWILWIPPGVLLIAGGLLALITPQRLRSLLLGQDSKTEYVDPIGQALFVGSILAGIGLLTVVLTFAGILFIGAEEVLKEDTARDEVDFSRADMAASLGRMDEAVHSYDDILSRNQSNIQAWHKRAEALGQLGRYDEAVESYEKALELDPENEALGKQLEEARKTMLLTARKTDTNASLQENANLALEEILFCKGCYVLNIFILAAIKAESLSRSWQILGQGSKDLQSGNQITTLIRSQPTMVGAPHSSITCPAIASSHPAASG
jgi:tetratricopeptide (TPR) repeat protein